MSAAPDAAAPTLRFLCDALARDGGEQRRARLAGFIAAAPDWPALVHLAGEQKVTPALASALTRWGLLARLPADLRDYLTAAAALNRARNRALLAELEEVAQTLNTAGLVPLAMKGAANLLAGLYDDPAERLLVDLDLLLPAADLAAGVAALRAAGWQQVGPAEMTLHHAPALHRAGCLATVELHRDPLDQPWQALLGGREMLAAAAPRHLGTARLLLPAAGHRLAQALAHGALADRSLALGRLALRDLDDAARLAAAPAVAAAALERRFAAVGQPAALAAMAAALDELLGCALPLPTLPLAARRRGARWFRRTLTASRRPLRAALRARITRPWLLLRRSLAEPALRRRLLRMLARPAWYRRQWNSLRGR